MLNHSNYSKFKMDSKQKKELENRNEDQPHWFHEMYGEKPPDYMLEWARPEPDPNGFKKIVWWSIMTMLAAAGSVYAWVYYIPK